MEVAGLPMPIGRYESRGATMTEFKRPWWWPWNFRIVWALWRLMVRWRYRRTGDCGLDCGWYEPFGFVPEAECPIHDRSQWTPEHSEDYRSIAMRQQE